MVGRTAGVVLLATLLAFSTFGCTVRTGSASFGGGPGAEASTNQTNEIEVTNLLSDPSNPLRLRGHWTGRFTSRPGDYVQFKRTVQSSGGQTTSVFGFSAAEMKPLAEASDGPVHVRLPRDAGALIIDGAIADAKGSGTIEFLASDRYAEALSKCTGEGLSPEQAMDLALIDLTQNYFTGLCDAGYRFSIADLRMLRLAGVSTDFAKALYQAGYRFSAGDLRALKFAGVGADYAIALRDAGYQLKANDLRSLRFAGVPAEYAAAMKHAGYDFSTNELRQLRFAGVPADFATKLRDAGYRFDADALRQLRFAGVPAEYAAALKRAGYSFSPDELRHLRFSGVPADFAIAAASPGHANLSADELIHLHFRGVDAQTLKKLRE